MTHCRQDSHSSASNDLSAVHYRKVPPITPMRLLADSMLGKLAKWLRLIGVDTVYIRDADDSDLVRLALKEDRILLTRDGPLANHRMLRGRTLFITSERTFEQLKQVVAELGIRIDHNAFFTRCIVCNSPIVAVEREWAKDKVPPYVFETQECFGFCSSCNKVFWRGTHVDHILAAIEQLAPPTDG